MSNVVYMIKWDTLHQFGTSGKRSPCAVAAYSFALLLPDCELTSNNPDASLDKIHLCLAQASR